MPSLIIWTLLLTASSYADTCISKDHALEVARVNIEAYNNSLDQWEYQTQKLDFEELEDNFEFYNSYYSYTSTNNAIYTQEVQVSCLGKFSMTRYLID